MQDSLETRRSAHLIGTDALETLLRNGTDTLCIVDLRGYVRTETNPDGGQTAQYLGAREEYDVGHIPGAVYLDWTRDIVDESDPVPAQVAAPDKLSRAFGSIGIGDETPVILYDNHPASQFATRLWWVLRYVGHTNARVLDGGWAKWGREGRPTTAATPAPCAARFTPRVQPELRATAEDVLRQINSPGSLLLDARDEGQYTGRIRRGKRGGHIPTARHLPREALFGAEGTFQTSEALQQMMTENGIAPEQRIVAYCNGGVAATSVLFALSLLGFPHLTNYDGSWNEWAEREDLPVENGPGDRARHDTKTGATGV